MAIFSTANILRNTTAFLLQQSAEFLDWIHRLTDIIHAIDKPILVVGLGANGYLYPTPWETASIYPDLDPNGKMVVDPTREYFPPLIKEMLQALHHRLPQLFVRGKYTEAAVRNHGFEKALAVGCPSLFLNPDPMHGLALQRAYSYLRTAISPSAPADHFRSSFRFMVGLPAYYAPRAWRMTLSILERYPNSIIVIQDDRDRQHLAKARTELQLSQTLQSLLETQQRWFTSLDSWLRSTHAFHAIFSWRIHGTMIGIAAGVPSLLVCPDLRVLEMAEVMKIPYVTPFFPALSVEPFDPLPLLADIPFNGTAYDQNRKHMAITYINTMKALGMPPGDVLVRLASQKQAGLPPQRLH